MACGMMETKSPLTSVQLPNTLAPQMALLQWAYLCSCPAFVPVWELKCGGILLFSPHSCSLSIRLPMEEEMSGLASGCSREQLSSVPVGSPREFRCTQRLQKNGEVRCVPQGLRDEEAALTSKLLGPLVPELPCRWSLPQGVQVYPKACGNR